MILKYILVVVGVMGGVVAANGQPFVPGNTYYGRDNYIEYFAGNAPLIISVPHGGYLEPTGMPDRNCTDCSYVRDAYTQELSRLIKDKFYDRTGCYPHMIVNLIHRKKLDMNRELIAATDSNAALDDYWYDYHEFVDSAKSTVFNNYAKGLFIDMHGHGHVKQRIELGYLVSKTTLSLADSLINLPTYTNFTSIRNLALDNLSALSHVSLLRGSSSMGTYLATRGFPSVPSSADPFPLAADEYFNGGYNTVRHGSNSSGKIDAIQFELYSAIRFDSVERVKFADSMVSVLIKYLDTHYFTNYAATPCITTAVDEVEDNGQGVRLYPNPAKEWISMQTDREITYCRIVSSRGQVMRGYAVANVSEPLWVADFPHGLYLVQLYDNQGKIYSVRLLKD